MYCIDCQKRKRWIKKSFLCTKCFNSQVEKLREKYGRAHKNDYEKWKKIASANGISTQLFNQRILKMSHEKAATTKKNERNKKKILRYTLDGEYINTYDSLAQAHMDTGISKAGISQCCSGGYKQAGGFVFRLEADVDVKEKQANA